MKFTPPRQSPTPEQSTSQSIPQPTQQPTPQPLQQPAHQPDPQAGLQPRRPSLQPNLSRQENPFPMPGAFEGSSPREGGGLHLRGGGDHVVDMPDLGAPAGDTGQGGMVSKLADGLRKGVTQPLKRAAASQLGAGEHAALSKHSSSWVVGGLFSKVKSTISEPMDMTDKAAAVFTNLAKAKLAKVGPAFPASLDQNSLEIQDLSTVHCKALTSRLGQATRVLDALARPDTSAGQLHELTTSKLKPNPFPLSALEVKALSKAYRGRQRTDVRRSPAAHIEQGIKTLNLAHEAAELHGLVAPAAAPPAGARPSNKLATAATALDASRALATTRLGTFRQSYTDFVQDELGGRIDDETRPKIDTIANPLTRPSDRNTLHTEVMARAIAGKRIDAALRNVTDLGEREALRARIDGLRVNPIAQHGDSQVIDLVHQLAGRTPPAGADQFLRGIAEQKGAPLDETLRVHKSVYRTAYQPTRAPGQAGALADWKDGQAKDMEMVNTELTSIALHVSQANRLGTLDAQLTAVFPNAAGLAAPSPEHAQIKQNFETSCAALVQRQPGQLVSAQDKVNIKLAKCILDNGEGVKGIAQNLHDMQTTYATKLENSPEMKKLLGQGSSGASYDPVEQRKNAGARLSNLKMGILDYSQSAGVAYDARTGVPETVIRGTIADARGIVASDRAGMTAVTLAKVEALEHHLFLMENYVRTENSSVPGELLRQLGDNDPRCGTDAVVAENATAYGNFGAGVGFKPDNPHFSASVGVDIAVATQWPAPNQMGLNQRNQVPNNIVLTESTAYSIKSVCNLSTHSIKGAMKAGGAMGWASSEQEKSVVKSALALSGSGGIGFERVVIENTDVGLACMVHKAPVLDGTNENGKISNETYIGMNDAVNRALFQPVRVGGVTPVASTIPGWDNLNHFFAATERATLEPLTKREVTLSLFDQSSAQFGGSFSGSASKNATVSEGSNPTFPNGAARKATFAGRVGAGVETKFSHSFRDEQILTPTLNKRTISDTLSKTRTATAGASLRLGGSIPPDGGARYGIAKIADAALAAARRAAPADAEVVKTLEAAAKQAHTDDAHMPRVRFGSQLDLAKSSVGFEPSRDYKEDYKRVVKDQFGNEIPALVRDSRTSNNGRLLVNNLVNEVGLLNATMDQRIDAAAMSAVEKQTVTKLLCLSTIASHYQNAGALDVADVPNDNLTINVTASLSPAAAARHAAVKGGFGRPATGDEQAHILANSLNYQTLGAAGGFKNQNTTERTNMMMVRTKRSTSSAQSAGYPSGVDVISPEAARRFDTFLRERGNSDIRKALQSVGMGEPLQLLADYNRVAHPDRAPIDTTPQPVIAEEQVRGDSERDLRALEEGRSGGIGGIGAPDPIEMLPPRK